MARLCDFVSLHDSCSMLRHGLVCDLSEMSGGVLWASARKGFSVMTQRQLSTVSLGEESADITESSFLMLMLHASGMRGRLSLQHKTGKNGHRRDSLQVAETLRSCARAISLFSFSLVHQASCWAIQNIAVVLSLAYLKTRTHLFLLITHLSICNTSYINTQTNINYTY